MINKLLLLGNLGLTAYNFWDRNRDQRNLFEESLLLRKSATNKLLQKVEELKASSAENVDILELQKLIENHIKATAENNQQKKDLNINFEDSAFLYAYAVSTCMSNLVAAADEVIRNELEGQEKIDKLLEGFDRYKQETIKYREAIGKLAVFVDDPDNAHLYFQAVRQNA